MQLYKAQLLRYCMTHTLRAQNQIKATIFMETFQKIWNNLEYFRTYHIEWDREDERNREGEKNQNMKNL